MIIHSCIDRAKSSSRRVIVQYISTITYILQERLYSYSVHPTPPNALPMQTQIRLYTMLASGAHLLSSISFHTSFILSRFSFAAARFLAVRSSRCARRHMFTLCLASVQLPVTFQIKPRAWHSSRAATTSAQSGRQCQ